MAKDRSLVEAGGVESGSRARVRVPSAVQACPLRCVPVSGWEDAPCLPVPIHCVLSVPCGSQPCV